MNRSGSVNSVYKLSFRAGPAEIKPLEIYCNGNSLNTSGLAVKLSVIECKGPMLFIDICSKAKSCPGSDIFIQTILAKAT